MEKKKKNVSEISKKHTQDYNKKRKKFNVKTEMYKKRKRKKQEKCNRNRKRKYNVLCPTC